MYWDQQLITLGDHSFCLCNRSNRASERFSIRSLVEIWTILKDVHKSGLNRVYRAGTSQTFDYRLFATWEVM